MIHFAQAKLDPSLELIMASCTPSIGIDELFKNSPEILDWTKLRAVWWIHFFGYNVNAEVLEKVKCQTCIMTRCQIGPKEILPIM
jgi:hypothetical protein